MSIFSALRNPYSYEEAFGAKDCTSQDMREAILEWFQLYYNQQATPDHDPCQRIAYTVVKRNTRSNARCGRWGWHG
jgi:hypothetical protein